MTIFFALPHAWDRAYHIRMEVFYLRLSETWRRTVDVMSSVAGIVVFGLMAIQGARFVPFMIHGAGFIGIVLAMLARGNPYWVLLGAALFGASLALTTALQVAGLNIPTDVVQMLPFAMVIVVLVLFARHSYLPPSLALPYHRGER